MTVVIGTMLWLNAMASFSLAAEPATRDSIPELSGKRVPIELLAGSAVHAVAVFNSTVHFEDSGDPLGEASSGPAPSVEVFGLSGVIARTSEPQLRLEAVRVGW